MKNELVKKVDEFVSEADSFQGDSYAVAYRHGLLNLGDNIDEHRRNLSEFGEGLSEEERNTASDHLKDRTQTQYDHQIGYGCLGGFVGLQTADALHFFNETISQYDPDHLMVGGFVLGAVIGAKIAKDVTYTALNQVWQYVRPNED